MSGLHRRRRRETSTEAYAAMLSRMDRGFGRRLRKDHQIALPLLHKLETDRTNEVNLALYEANRIDGVSLNQLASEMRASKQAIAKRVNLGAEIARQRDRDLRLTASDLQTSVRTARPRELPPGG